MNESPATAGTGPVFRGYDQAALDAQYNNRLKVPSFEDYLRRYHDDSAAVRQQWGDRARFDVAVGDSAIERVDVFPPLEGGRGSAPVLVFIHGGYWLMLDKSEFSFVARGFAAHGIATVVINYGLIPSVRMAEIVRQCRQAVAWTVANAASFGGDPARVAVAGHSAGGHLTAMVGSNGWQPDRPLVAGYAISGLHDLVPISRCYLQQSLKLEPDEVDRFSPSGLAPPRLGHWLAIVGGLEGPEYLRQSVELVTGWQSAGERTVALQVARDHDHFSIVMTLGDPVDPLTRMIATDLLQRRAR
jgi:arylformamidase